MNRRSFLKTVAAASGAAAAYALTGTPVGKAAASFQPRPVELAFQGRLLRGMPDGRLLESRDDGQSWQKIRDFGSHCAVLALVERGSLLYAKVGLKNYSFLLKSADARAWRTA